MNIVILIWLFVFIIGLIDLFLFVCRYFLQITGMLHYQKKGEYNASKRRS